MPIPIHPYELDPDHFDSSGNIELISKYVVLTQDDDAKDHYHYLADTSGGGIKLDVDSTKINSLRVTDFGKNFSMVNNVDITFTSGETCDLKDTKDDVILIQQQSVWYKFNFRTMTGTTL